MKRLVLLVKGNVDVHDSLHSCRIGGVLTWNGINDVLRNAFPGITARVKHETWTRSDALLRSDGTVPKAIRSRELPLGPYPAASQFSRAVFETPADAIVLSIQADIATALVQHRNDGFLFYPSQSERWSARDREWLRSDFELLEPLAVAQSMENLRAVIATIRERNDAPILIYNLSPVAPGETIHCYRGIGETFSTRIRRFNLALIELSEATGISIIDVDLLAARYGADAFKLDALHLMPAGYRAVAEEVVRVLEDIGVLDDRVPHRRPISPHSTFAGYAHGGRSGPTTK